MPLRHEKAVPAPAGGLILERDRELAELEAMLADADAGSGGLAVIEGPPGIGKTRLLEATRDLASRTGFRILSARGGELERDFAFGVVRQIFEPTLTALSPDERDVVLIGAAALAAPLFTPVAAEDEPKDAYGTLHGLYWLTANLADRWSLLIAVDDAHWCDVPSIRFLDFVARRLDGVRVLVALAMRANEPGTAGTPLPLLGQHSVAHVVRPMGLSEHAVGELIAADLGWEPYEALRRACHQATGGNPFLLKELLAELRSTGATPEGALALINEVGPERVAQTVMQRLGLLGAAASTLARAVAVLGQTADLRHAAQLAGLGLDEAAMAAGALADARVLERSRPLRFLHPILRAAIYQALAQTERAGAHARAARVLESDGATPETVAPHLLACDPSGDPWLVETLRAAAGAAMARGGPEIAVRFLRRALEEPAPEPVVAPLLLELGTAGSVAGTPDALDTLRHALQRSGDPSVRAGAALELGRTLGIAGRLQESAAVLHQAIEGLGDTKSELRWELEAALLVGTQSAPFVRQMFRERLRQIEKECDVGTKLPGSLLSIIALEKLIVSGTAAEAAAVAERALGGGRLLAQVTADAASFQIANAVLMFSGRLQEVLQSYDQAIADARSRGSARGFALTSCSRGWTHYLAGAIPAAESDARASIELGLGTAFEVMLPIAISTIVEASIDRGELAAAEAIIDDLDGGREEDSTLWQVLRMSRARLRLHQRRPLDALRDTMACADWEDRWGGGNGVFVLWRAGAALAHAALGEDDKAREMAREQVDLARRFGAPRTLGMSLQVAGSIEGGNAGAELLEEAVSVLEPSEARLESARALTELGAAWRRLGRRLQARVVLRSAQEQARSCGATALAERARRELLATGARPRRIAVLGRDALTPSERRIADAAVQGMTNREIAQALFITTKTVETHLRAVFQKLAIRSRIELATALAMEEPKGRSGA